MFGFGGTSGFGTFGQNTLANKPATSTFPSTGTSLFGAPTNTGGFGATQPAPSTNVFGQPQTSTSTNIFGGGFNQPKPATSNIFGASQGSSMFGQPNRLPGGTGTGGLFSGSTTATVSPFSTGQNQPAGTSVQFNPITGTDTMMRNGVASPISTRNQCITCMKEYENKSLEELRLEDYQIGRKGPSQGNVFGGSQPQASTGIFSMSQTGPTSTFGQPTTAFGGGAPATTGLFTGLQQPKPATSFFPSANPATSAFGGGTTTPFSFSSTTTQPLFGTSSTATTGGAFGFNQPQQMNQPSVFGSNFGAKPLTTQATSTPFGGLTTNTSAAITKPVPLFGSSTPFGQTPNAAPFGQTPSSLFPTSNQQQNKPPFSFGGFPQAPATAFGGTGGTFSFSNPTSSAGLNFSPGTGFGSTGTTTGGFPSFATNTTTNFGTSITNTGFGSSNFPSLGGQTTTPGLSLFNTLNPVGGGNVQPNFNISGGSVPFGTTPYKDSPLFYNLITNRNLEEMTKPTNPVAQRQIREASRRKTSTSLNVSSGGAIKNLTFPAPKNNSVLKDPFFDGFEEEDQGTTIDILSPKTSVKKLVLKNLRFSRHSLNKSSFNGQDDYSRRDSSSGSGGNRLSMNDSSNVSNVSAHDGSDLDDGALQNEGSSVLNESVNNSTPSDSFYLAVNNRMVNGNGDSFNGENRNDTVYEPPNVTSYDGAQNPCGVKCTRSGYYISPQIKELDLLTDAQGNCFVRGFIVGRHNFGEIRFLDVVNVGNIDIDETVLFRHKEVVVYPDDGNKPPVGEGINVPAEIRLERVWPIDKITKDPIKIPSKIKALKYEDKLKRSCSRLNADFISYDEQTGLWVFRVKHFSKYSCAPEEEEDDDGVIAMEAAKGIGMGGKTVQQLKSAAGPTQALMITDEGPSSMEGAVVSVPKTKATAFSDHVPSIYSSPLSSSETGFIGGIGEPHANNIVELTSGKKGPATTTTVRDFGLGECSDVSDQVYDMMDDKVDEIPDYFGLTELHMPSSIPEPTTSSSPKVLPKIQSVKIPQHRKRDEIPFIDATKKQSKFYQLQIYPQSNYRRGTRVCFGRGGTFARIINKSKDYPRMNRFLGQVKIEKLKPWRKLWSAGEGDIDVYSKVITKQLSLMMNYSCPDNLFQLRPEGIIGELIKVFTSSEDSDSLKLVKGCEEELQLWQLCNILWPSEELTEGQLKDEGYLLEYRVQLGQWLKSNASMLFGDLYDASDTSLKGLLMKGMHLEACELAVQEGNFNLALNLSQCCGESQKVMFIQMDEWIRLGVTPFIPKDVLEVYRLCSGQPIWDDIDLRRMTTSQWLQHFAIYLWYIAPLECSIDEAVINYQALIQEYCDVGDDEEINFPSQHDSSNANACIHLLKAYSCVGYPMKNLLNPRTNNPDCLDYKLSWILMHNLRQFGYLSDLELVEDLTLGLAGQLDSMGLFQWAIFVLKSLPETVSRNVMIDRILERNVSVQKNDEGKTFEFLEQLMGIPRSHILAHCYKL